MSRVIKPKVKVLHYVKELFVSCLQGLFFSNDICPVSVTMMFDKNSEDEGGLRTVNPRKPGRLAHRFRMQTYKGFRCRFSWSEKPAELYGMSNGIEDLISNS